MEFRIPLYRDRKKKCSREKDVTKMKTKWLFPHCKWSIGKGLSLRRQLSRQEGMDCCLRTQLQEWNGFKIAERKYVAMPSLGLGWKDGPWAWVVGLLWGRCEAGTCLLVWISGVLETPGSCPLQAVLSWVLEFGEATIYTSLCYLPFDSYSEGEL